MNKKPMSALNDIFNDQMEKIPHHFLAHLLKQKIERLDQNISEKEVQAFVAHIFNNPDEPFQLDDGSDEDDHTISLEITEEEVKALERQIEDFIENDLPEFVQNVAHDSAASILKTLRKDWLSQKKYQADEAQGFTERLEHDWGEAFDRLRMMLTISREIGPEFSSWTHSDNARDTPARYAALVRLHARGCQVADEIICLMANGFADGAFARWRTLHEIAVIATLIAYHDEELAVRYFDHEHVEDKRAMDHFKLHYEALGYEKPSDEEIDVTEQNYRDCLNDHGDGFGAALGWAAPHLAKRRVTFIDLEDAVGQISARSYYKLASYNVHASPKGIRHRLGLINQDDVLLAGRSNVGFFEPAHNTAQSLCQLNATILRDRWDLDTITTYLILLDLWKEVPDACQHAKEMILARDKARKASQSGS